MIKKIDGTIVDLLFAPLSAGEVTISVKPSRPHCPCCLLDLDKFRTKLLETKGVSFATLNVVGVPASDRWTRTLNRSM